MSPRIPANSYILLLKKSRFTPTEIGQTWLIQHPEYGDIIKTLSEITQSREFKFTSEHYSGVTQDQLGTINSEQLIAKVIFTIPANL